MSPARQRPTSLLQTGTGLTTEDYAKDGNTYHARSTWAPTVRIKYYAVDGTCIANHMTKSAPDSLIWSAICLGMATDGLCAPAARRGRERVLRLFPVRHVRL